MLTVARGMAVAFVAWGLLAAPGLALTTRLARRHRPHSG